MIFKAGGWVDHVTWPATYDRCQRSRSQSHLTH